VISIVDPNDLQYLLRPTVYRPLVGDGKDVRLPRAPRAEDVIVMRSPRAEDTEPRG